MVRVIALADRVSPPPPCDSGGGVFSADVIHTPHPASYTPPDWSARKMHQIQFWLGSVQPAVYTPRHTPAVHYCTYLCPPLLHLDFKWRLLVIGTINILDIFLESPPSDNPLDQVVISESKTWICCCCAHDGQSLVYFGWILN